MDNEIYTVDKIRNLILSVLIQYGVEKAYIFGSYARDEATPESDIDIMIGRGDSIKSLFVLGGLFEDLKQALNKEIDLVTEETYTNPYADELAEQQPSSTGKEINL